MSDPVYRRAIVKLSGEALSAANGFGIDQATVERLATDLAAAAKLGVELGVDELALHARWCRAPQMGELVLVVAVFPQSGKRRLASDEPRRGPVARSLGHLRERLADLAHLREHTRAPGTHRSIIAKRAYRRRMDPTGKVAVVTGGGNGIGRATSRLFAHHGARIVVADIAETAGHETVMQIVGAGGEAAFVRLDATVRADNEAAMRLALDRFGSLDILVTSAGINNARTQANQSVAEAFLSSDSVSDFVANLEATKWFIKPVELLDSQVQPDAKAGDLVRFSLKATLNNPELPAKPAGGRGAKP